MVLEKNGAARYVDGLQRAGPWRAEGSLEFHLQVVREAKNLPEDGISTKGRETKAGRSLRGVRSVPAFQQLVLASPNDLANRGTIHHMSSILRNAAEPQSADRRTGRLLQPDMLPRLVQEPAPSGDPSFLHVMIRAPRGECAEEQSIAHS